MKMNNRNEMSATILANTEVFDYLKEKVGERKTRTEAYCDLLDKSMAGFVSPYLRKQNYELQQCQCHVTVSDLAVEWHWHRATVRSFLDTLESLGQLRRIRLPKSIVITMPLQIGQTAGIRDVQQAFALAERLRAALSDWITGKIESDDAGAACDGIVCQAMEEMGIHDGCSSPDSSVPANVAADDGGQAVRICTTALECIALAALQKVLRTSRHDDSSELIRYFRLELHGDWTGIVEMSRLISRLILEPEVDDATGNTDDEAEFLKTLLKPFLALAARAQETRLSREVQTSNV